MSCIRQKICESCDSGRVPHESDPLYPTPSRSPPRSAHLADMQSRSTAWRDHLRLLTNARSIVYAPAPKRAMKINPPAIARFFMK